MLATLRLYPARTSLISGFIDTYLELNRQEEQRFQEEIGKLKEPDKEEIMEIVTSWGKQATRSLIIRQLNRRVGQLPETITSQIENLPIQQLEALGEALLDFTTLADLETWLEVNHG
ncbi:DUF4351 domain-containing protein [Scytonema sp. NUACC26]|uniref:DUF4351 domain-containing protein n=1 Tax=Scytonema sp. NUACC26 TaxID=3140176 RepID=UPI0038B297C8